MGRFLVTCVQPSHAKWSSEAALRTAAVDGSSHARVAAGRCCLFRASFSHHEDAIRFILMRLRVFFYFLFPSGSGLHHLGIDSVSSLLHIIWIGSIYFISCSCMRCNGSSIRVTTAGHTQPRTQASTPLFVLVAPLP